MVRGVVAARLFRNRKRWQVDPLAPMHVRVAVGRAVATCAPTIASELGPLLRRKRGEVGCAHRWSAMAARCGNHNAMPDRAGIPLRPSAADGTGSAVRTTCRGHRMPGRWQCSSPTSAALANPPSPAFEPLRTTRQHYLGETGPEESPDLSSAPTKGRLGTR
jgi:hypothetical protein